jgi:cytochrome c-type biogenesis protein
MEWLFTHLTRAVDGAPLVAIAAAFTWGVLSIVLSPCHLASIPLIVGFIAGQGRVSAARALLIATLFASGILLTIALIGALTAAAGRMLGDIGGAGNYLVAAVFILVGLYLVDVMPLNFGGAVRVRGVTKGLIGALLLGLIFGVALGPCTFAYMAPMLGVTFKLASTSLPYGVLLLMAYAVGHCAVIVAAGTSTEMVQRYLNWADRSGPARALKPACGLLLIFGGMYFVYSA